MICDQWVLDKARFEAAQTFIPCYDGEGGGSGGELGESGGKPNETQTFTQEQLNKIVEERLARDRRTRDPQRETQFRELETQYKTLLDSKSLDAEERSRLEDSLANVQKQLRSKEEQARLDRELLEKQTKERVTALEQERDTWRNRYTDQTIERAIIDAALTNDAYSPTQFVSLLKPNTRLVEKTDESGRPTGTYQVMVDSADKQVSVEDAVQKMKTDLAQFGNLFKPNVAPGLGASVGNGGLTPGSNGRVDITKLSDAEYDKLRRENPRLLGLRK